MKSPKERTMNGKIRSLKRVQIPQRCFTGGSWVRTSQAEMPWPGVALMKSSKIQKKKGWGSPHRSQQGPQSHWGNSFCLGGRASPRPLRWPVLEQKPGMRSARFQIASVSIILPCTGTQICSLAQIQRSERSVPNSASPWAKPGGTAFGSNLSLFCNKTVCL